MSFLFKKVTAQDEDGRVIRESEIKEWSKTHFIVKYPSKFEPSGWRYVAYTHKPIINNGGVIVNDSCGEDAAEFKVGDKVKGFLGQTEIVQAVGPGIFRVKGGHGGSLYPRDSMQRLEADEVFVSFGGNSEWEKWKVKDLNGGSKWSADPASFRRGR